MNVPVHFSFGVDMSININTIMLSSSIGISNNEIGLLLIHISVVHCKLGNFII